MGAKQNRKQYHKKETQSNSAFLVQTPNQNKRNGLRERERGRLEKPNILTNFAENCVRIFSKNDGMMKISARVVAPARLNSTVNSLIIYNRPTEIECRLSVCGLWTLDVDVFCSALGMISTLYELSLIFSFSPFVKITQSRNDFFFSSSSSSVLSGMYLGHGCHNSQPKTDTTERFMRNTNSIVLCLHSTISMAVIPHESFCVNYIH